MEVVNTDNHLYYFYFKKIDPEVKTSGRNVLKAFDVREFFFILSFSILKRMIE